MTTSKVAANSSYEFKLTILSAEFIASFGSVQVRLSGVRDKQQKNLDVFPDGRKNANAKQIELMFVDMQ